MRAVSNEPEQHEVLQVYNTHIEESQAVQEEIIKMQEVFIETQVDKVSEENFRTHTVEVGARSPSKTAIRRAKQKLIKLNAEDQKRDPSFM